MTRKNKGAVSAVLLAAAIFAPSASAAIVFDGSPGAGPAPATLGGIPISPMARDTRSNFNVVTDAPGLAFDRTMMILTSHVGWDSPFWEGGAYTGFIYWNMIQGDVTITLATPASAFAFVAAPDPDYGTRAIEAVAQDGTSSGPIVVQASRTSSGGQFFGFYGTGGDKITSVRVSLPGTNAFGVGDFYVGVAPSPPTATISSPADGQTYTLNQVVSTSFTCSAGAGGNAVSTCNDSNNATSPGHLDTATAGPHTYIATATATDGQTGTTQISYTVAGKPTAAISSPANNQTYALGQVVNTAFSCGVGVSGRPISTCKDSNNATSPGHLDTATAGPHTYIATATATDGQTGTAQITYTVTKGIPTLTAAATSSPKYILSATLKYAGTPISGQTITFTAGTTTLCSAVTIAGVATCSPNSANKVAISAINNARGYTASYAGDINYSPTSATGTFGTGGKP